MEDKIIKIDKTFQIEQDLEIKVGDIIGNTIQGFDFEVISLSGDKIKVKNTKTRKELETYIGNMRHPSNTIENTIYHGDCLKIMKYFPDNFVDHIICDLPFYQVVKDEWDNQWKDEYEYIEWCRSIITEYKRILKKNGNIFLFTGRQFNRKISIILDEFFVEKRIIIWSRKRNFNNTRGKALASGYEPICYYCNGEDGIFNNIKIKVDTNRKEYVNGILKDGVTLSDVWSDIPALPHNSKEKLNHTTQKPQKLIERIIQMGTNEGDLILDNCCGSGTLAIECIKNNRRWIMIEKEDEYFKMSLERIENFQKSFL